MVGVGWRAVSSAAHKRDSAALHLALGLSPHVPSNKTSIGELAPRPKFYLRVRAACSLKKIFLFFRGCAKIILCSSVDLT